MTAETKRRIHVTDHAIARLLERVPRIKGMPEDHLRAAVGASVAVGERQGKVMLASDHLPSLYLVVAEEPTQRVVVSVIPRFDARVGLASDEFPAERVRLGEEIERLRAALDTAAAKIRESAAREQEARREADTLREKLRRALRCAP